MGEQFTVTPGGYTPLSGLQVTPLESSVSVIGVVTDYMPPTPSKGTGMSFNLHA